jgi:hypothetical protein
LTELVRNLSLAGLPLREEFLVVLGVGEDDNSVVVLGSGTEKGYTSDVDFLDGFRDGRRGNASDSLVERVKVADDDRDGSDLLGEKVGLVGRDVASEDTCRFFEDNESTRSRMRRRRCRKGKVKDGN